MADASDLRGNGIDVDPKQLFDDYSSTKLPPKGYHLGGIDDNNCSIFMPVTDNTDTTDITTGSKIPASVLPPRLGKRLSGS